MGNGMLSQEEIDALLGGNLAASSPEENEPVVDFGDMERDAIGEIANISMGTAATTLSQLLGKKVEITTPKVDIASSEQIRQDYPIPSVIVDVRYKAGIEGSNLLILSQRDGAVIVDLMMGGNGQNPSPELSEMGISGISEAMNQMMGSAATSMSTMFNSVVDITPPQLVLNDMSSQEDNVIISVLNSDEKLIRISFRMVVEDVIDSILVQVIPIHVAKGMVNKLLGSMGGTSSMPDSQPEPNRRLPIKRYIPRLPIPATGNRRPSLLMVLNHNTNHTINPSTSKRLMHLPLSRSILSRGTEDRDILSLKVYLKVIPRVATIHQGMGRPPHLCNRRNLPPCDLVTPFMGKRILNLFSMCLCKSV